MRGLKGELVLKKGRVDFGDSLLTWLEGFSDDPLVPLHLLVYAIQTAVTTMTCIAEYLSWQGYSLEQKWALGQLYVPYLVLCESHPSFTGTKFLHGWLRASGWCDGSIWSELTRLPQQRFSWA